MPKKREPDEIRKYRSKFERTVGDFLGERVEYEPERLYFIQPSKQRFYIPDFKTKGGIYLECKGKWTSEDRSKHLWLKEQHPDKRIILIFQNARVKLNKRSQTTYGEWATKNNIEWYDWKSGIPEEILNNNEYKLNHRNTRRVSRTASNTKSRTSAVSNRSRTKSGSVKGGSKLPS